MIVVPVNQSYKLLDNNHLAGTACTDVKFTFSGPVSKIYLQGAQVGQEDDIPATAEYSVWEGIGADRFNSIDTGVWTDPLGTSNIPVHTLSTVTAPGFDGCAVYMVTFDVTPTGHAAFDFCVIGVSA